MGIPRSPGPLARQVAPWRRQVCRSPVWAPQRVTGQPPFTWETAETQWRWQAQRHKSPQEQFCQGGLPTHPLAADGGEGRVWAQAARWDARTLYLKEQEVNTIRLGNTGKGKNDRCEEW